MSQPLCNLYDSLMNFGVADEDTIRCFVHECCADPFVPIPRHYGGIKEDFALFRDFLIYNDPSEFDDIDNDTYEQEKEVLVESIKKKLAVAWAYVDQDSSIHIVRY